MLGLGGPITFHPKNMWVIIFDESEFLVGTSAPPKKDHEYNTLFFKEFYPKISEDGKNQLTGSRVVRGLNPAFWKPVPFMEQRGIPKMGLGLYIHPKSPIITKINNKALSELAHLRAKNHSLESEIKALKIKLGRISKEPKQAMMEDVVDFGRATRESRGYPTSRYPSFIPPRERRRRDDEW